MRGGKRYPAPTHLKDTQKAGLRGGGVGAPSQGGLAAASETDGVGASLNSELFLTAGPEASEVEPQGMGAHAGELGVVVGHREVAGNAPDAPDFTDACAFNTPDAPL